MVRVNFSPAPLSKVSVTGESGVSVALLRAVHRVEPSGT